MTNWFDLFSSTYGLVLLAGIIASAALLLLTGKKYQLKLSQLGLLCILSLALGIVCSRGYHVVMVELFGYGFHGPFFSAEPYQYSFCGAMLGVLLACWIAALLTHTPTLRMLNATVCPGLVLIVFARVAETWADFGWGPALNPAWMQRFPIGVKDMFWGEWHFALFYPEALFALALCIILALGQSKKEIRFPLALIWWSMAQIFFESFRVETLKWGFIRVQQVQCAVFAACMMIVFCHKCKGQKVTKKLSGCWIAYILGVATVVLLEFALDKFTWPRWLDYIAMALVLTGMAFAARKIVLLAHNKSVQEDR